MKKYMRTQNRYSVHSKRGMTLIELVAAIAIAGIVGAMTITLFIFPQRVMNKGEELADIQLKLRMVSNAITREIRLASGVEILATGASIPPVVTNDDQYIFINTSDHTLVIRDKTGDKSTVFADELNLSFSVSEPYRLLSYTVSGRVGREDFSLSSQVLPLNLPADQTITNSSGTGSGTIIKIENNLPSIDPTSLYFTMAAPFEGQTNQLFTRVLTPYNFTGSYSFAFSNGELPPGLGVIASGSISGMPTEAGVFTFSIKLTDSVTSATVAFVVTITEAEPPADSPVASDLDIVGNMYVGETITGQYTYTDPDLTGYLETDSIVVWWSMSDLHGSGKSELLRTTATAGLPSTYTIMNDDSGKFIYFEVIPISEDGRIGSSVSSDAREVPANSKPEAQDVRILDIKNPAVGDTVFGDYKYFDADGDSEALSLFQWYRSDNKDSDLASLDIITGATSDSYTLTSADRGKYIFFMVTPIAGAGKLIGDGRISANIGKIK